MNRPNFPKNFFNNIDQVHTYPEDSEALIQSTIEGSNNVIPDNILHMLQVLRFSWSKLCLWKDSYYVIGRDRNGPTDNFNIGGDNGFATKLTQAGSPWQFVVTTTARCDSLFKLLVCHFLPTVYWIVISINSICFAIVGAKK